VTFRLAALVAAVAIAFADSAIVVLALPDLLAQYDVSINGVAWVVTAYNVALALGALALAFFGRRFDPARLALAGGVVFAIASLVCAVAPDVWVLIAFRAVQGVAAAGLLVGALPVMRSLAPGRGAALWAGAGVFGTALGPALGGALTEGFSWRAIFAFQAPVAFAWALPRTRVRDAAIYALQMWAYVAHYEMPNDVPGELEARVHVRYPIRIDTVLGLGRTPTIRLQRALGRPGEVWGAESAADALVRLKTSPLGR